MRAVAVVTVAARIRLPNAIVRCDGSCGYWRHLANMTERSERSGSDAGRRYRYLLTSTERDSSPRHLSGVIYFPARGSLDPPRESSSRTASRFVQPFLRSSPVSEYVSNLKQVRLQGAF